MAIQHLDHYFVRARDLERSRHFYCELLGFAVMPRLRYIAEVALLQLFVRDPDGLMIELNYPGTATLPAWAADVEGYAP